jgi:hypothetical protein
MRMYGASLLALRMPTVRFDLVHLWWAPKGSHPRATFFNVGCPELLAIFSSLTDHFEVLIGPH